MWFLAQGSVLVKGEGRGREKSPGIVNLLVRVVLEFRPLVPELTMKQTRPSLLRTPPGDLWPGGIVSSHWQLLTAGLRSSETDNLLVVH